jgi:hypothetical protein
VHKHVVRTIVSLLQQNELGWYCHPLALHDQQYQRNFYRMKYLYFFSAAPSPYTIMPPIKRKPNLMPSNGKLINICNTESIIPAITAKPPILLSNSPIDILVGSAEFLDSLSVSLLVYI